MSNPFFLTRQTANLMEDFARELNQGPALFLLYGENGVGKTRLLQELSQSRLSERAIYWLDLGTGNGADEVNMDRSAEIEALFAAAVQGDIIIVDHFEMALKKTRHQLFLSWSTDGIDKKLNMIIASSSEGFTELSQLSQQYQVEAQSFQQEPFSADEVRSFLGFYLFPDNPMGKLSIPTPLRKQIVATQGIVGRLIEVADREGAQIESTVRATTDEPVRKGGRMIYAVIFLVVLALGAGWYLLSNLKRDEIPLVATSEPANIVVREAVSDDATAVETVVEPETATTPESATSGEADMQSASMPVEPASEDSAAGSAEEVVNQSTVESDDSTALAESTQDVVEPVATPVSEAEAPVEPEVAEEAAMADPVETQFVAELEPGTVPESEAVIEEEMFEDQASQASVDEAAAAETEQIPGSSQDRFELELKRSMEWISKRDSKVGTVQILLLSYENFDADNYFEYVANLARRGADTDKLRVFKTLTGNREVYSVVYDEFASRQAAIGAIAELPEVIKDTSPLARSVGGLWQEIRRLEAGN